VPLEAVLGAARNLFTATLPKQVFDNLTQEAYQMGVRAVVFEVRGKAAWGASAQGFEPQLTERALRALVVPLTADSPFRQVFEISRHFGGNSDALKKNANVLNRLKPKSDDSILLLPIRSAGAVSAIFYADSGGRGASLPEDALKLLAEFASVQLDRLMALTAREKAAASKEAGKEVQAEPAVSVEPPTEAAELPVEVAERSEATASRGETRAPSIEEPLPPLPPQPVIEAGAPVGPPHAEAPAELPGERPTMGSVPAPAPGAAVDVSQLSEAERKIHKDARRFAKLLVFEIELYNKSQVAEGRQSKDLYKRLKLDIDRSRQTFEQRFGKTVAKQFDYFHDELVRSLASNDPSLLGSDYPGPSV
jgi:hypothetical protein